MEAPETSAPVAAASTPRVSLRVLVPLTTALAVVGVLLALLFVQAAPFESATLVVAAAGLTWGRMQMVSQMDAGVAGEPLARAPLTLTDAALVIGGGMVLGSVLGGIFAVTAALLAGDPNHLSPAMSTVVNGAAQTGDWSGKAICLFLYAIDRHGVRLRDLGWRRPRSWWWLAAAPLLAGVGVFAGSYLQDLNQHLLPHVSNGQCTDVRNLYSALPWLAVPMVCLGAPLVEETLFRGVLYRSLRKRMGIGLGILVSALIFSAFHGQPVLFLPLAFFGAILAFAYEFSDSLVVGALTHGLFNAVGIYYVLFSSSAC